MRRSTSGDRRPRDAAFQPHFRSVTRVGATGENANVARQGDTASDAGKSAGVVYIRWSFLKLSIAEAGSLYQLSGSWVLKLVNVTTATRSTGTCRYSPLN